MFIASLTYVKPLEAVEKYLEEHRAFLEKYYAAGKMICSGRKEPRTGGVILCNAENAAEMRRILAEDPFQVHGIASYDLTEFYPTKYAPDFKRFVETSI